MDNITKDWNEDEVDFRKYRNKWQTKKEYETAKKVLDRVSELNEIINGSCPLPVGVVDSDATTAGYNWRNMFDLCYKLWSCWHLNTDDRSNIKSPDSFASVEAVMSEFQENVLGTTLTYTQESDKNKVKIIEHALKYLEGKARFNWVNQETLHECVITGNAWRGIFWKRICREVSLIQNSHRITQELYDTLQNGTKRERERVKKLLVEDRKPLSHKTTIVEYDDIVHIPISVYDVLVDTKSVKSIRGPTCEAPDLAWYPIVSLQQFRAEFAESDDPYVKRDNVNKVVSMSDSLADYIDSRPFFDLTGDPNSGDMVRLIHYFNKNTDKYIILANDVVIRDGPLPYNHKQIPLVLHNWTRWPNQLYGLGIPAMLENTQAEGETLRNMNIEQVKYDMARPMFFREDIFDSVDVAIENLEPNLKVPINGDPGTAIAWAPQVGYSPNYSQLRQSLDQDTIKASGINTNAYSMPMAGEAVRNNMMALESSLKMIKKGIKNYSAGYREAILQTIALMKQFYGKEYLEELAETGEETAEAIKRFRSIPTNGVKLNIDKSIYTEDGELVELNMEEELIDGLESGSLELKPEYFDLDGDVDVIVDTDTMVPTSQGLKMQNAERFMQTLIPILSNPDLMNNTAILGLVRYYAEVNGVPKETMDTFKDQTDEADIERAVQQNIEMLGGNEVAPIPGESEGHKWEHSKTIMDLVNEVMAVKNNPELDPNQMSVVKAQEMADKMNAKVDELEDQISRISMHVSGDDVPKDQRTQFTVGMAQQVEQASQPAPQVEGEVPQQIPPQMPPEAQMMANTGGQMPPSGPMI